jgi:predicted amidophosphoribosyltransferase
LAFPVRTPAGAAVSALRRGLAAHAAALADLLWPPACPACDARAEDPGSLFCDRCWSSLRPLRPGREGEMHPGAPPVLAPFSVDALLIRMLTASKYSGLRPVGRRLCRIAAERIAPALPEGAALVPVPLTRSRRRERGFNQTEDYAAALAEVTGLPVRLDWLVRKRGGKALAGRARRERDRAVRGAFRVTPRFPGSAAGSILLVDDVATTGSTGAACAEALAAAGSRPVATVVIGRAFAAAEDSPAGGIPLTAHL